MTPQMSQGTYGCTYSHKNVPNRHTDGIKEVDKLMDIQTARYTSISKNPPYAGQMRQSALISTLNMNVTQLVKTNFLLLKELENY